MDVLKTDTNTKKVAITNVTGINHLKKIIFPQIDPSRLPDIYIDPESIKFITYASSAREITNIIIEQIYDFPCPERVNEELWHSLSAVGKIRCLTITDITAGVGGNVINFAAHFNSVNAYELNPIRYSYLINNANVYERTNIEFKNGNSVELLAGSGKHDIIFFDPPWGGSSYKKTKNLRLTFDGEPIEKLCNSLLTDNKCTMLVLKLPYNYDFEHLYNEIFERKQLLEDNPPIQHLSFIKIPLERMTVVIIKNYPIT
jgi:16S rRNA G966 N2-methylase RsmD